MLPTHAVPALHPIAPAERIAALDVVRGLALFGIFMMNVEWFNRPVTDLGSGMPAGLEGLDYAAAWFVHTFVRGKFWTLFSLLFGMGFAVMLARAESAGRGFIAPYLRRTGMLAALGLLHGIGLWTGDILLSYATAAGLLVLTLFGRPWHFAALAGALGLATWALRAPLEGFIAVVVVSALLGAYLRGKRQWRLRGRAWPHPDPEQRRLRAGLLLYLGPVLAMTIAAGIGLATSGDGEPKRTPEQAQQVEQRRAEKRALVAEEARIMQSGSYAQAVRFRARETTKGLAEEGGFALLVMGLFLVGGWFVRSGVMRAPEAHLPLFRRLAFVGLPAGAAVAVVSSLVATGRAEGQGQMTWQLAQGLQLLSGLAMALGYMAAVVLLLRTTGGARVLGWLAPAGRMALSNYLLQSVVCSLVFYGYGLGYWGMPRAWQLVFVCAVFAGQVMLSRWWLARHGQGPVEWLWRRFTYLDFGTRLAPVARQPG